MKTMLKNKSFYLVILSLLVMLSGVACTEDTMMKEDEKMQKEGTMPEDTMMKEGEKMQKEGTLPEDTMMKEDEKMK